MRILHISIYPPKGEKHSPTGGVASYAKNLVTSTPYQAIDEVFVLADKIDDKSESYQEGNTTVVRCFNKNPFFIFQLIKEIGKIGPDVVHVQQELHLFGGYFSALILPLLFLWLKRYKLFVTIHGVVALSKINPRFVMENNSGLPVSVVKNAFYVLFKPLLVLADKIIVHETYFRDILVSEYGVKPAKISVIYHGVEDFAGLSKQEACQKLGLDERKRIILFLGYFTGYKGLDLLIEAFADYATKDKDAFLLIGAGKHPKLANYGTYKKEYERIKNKAAELIPATQYKWAGFVEEDQLAVYYGAADVSVYPYTVGMSSSGPMAMAMGYKKPFLASSVFAEIFDKDLIFERDRDSLSGKIAAFFKGEGHYKELVEKTRQERLWSKIGHKHLILYTS